MVAATPPVADVPRPSTVPAARLVSVTAPAFATLIRVTPVMFAALTVLAEEPVLKLSVSTPEIFNAPVVAVNPLMVALRMSAAPAESTTVSEAFRAVLKKYRSLPDPPDKESLPVPAVIESAAAPPVTVLEPAKFVRVITFCALGAPVTFTEPAWLDLPEKLKVAAASVIALALTVRTRPVATTALVIVAVDEATVPAAIVIVSIPEVLVRLAVPLSVVNTKVSLPVPPVMLTVSRSATLPRTVNSTFAELVITSAFDPLLTAPLVSKMVVAPVYPAASVSV